MRSLVLVALLLSSSTAARAEPEVGAGLGRFLMTYRDLDRLFKRNQVRVYEGGSRCP